MAEQHTTDTAGALRRAGAMEGGTAGRALQLLHTEQPQAGLEAFGIALTDGLPKRLAG